MFKPRNTKGYAQNNGGRNAFSGKRGYKKKFAETKLDTEPEAKTDPVNAIPEEPANETPVLETELDTTKELEK